MKRVLSKKWSDPYLQTLAIMDHCRELVHLHDAIAVHKAEKDCRVTLLQEQWEREAVDLALIINERILSGNCGIEHIVEERLTRFIQKESSNVR